MTRARRPVAILLSLLVPGLTLCLSTAAGPETAAFCPAAPAEAESRCPDEPADGCCPSQAPRGGDCRLCDGSVQFQAGAERESLGRPAPSTPARIATAPSSPTLRNAGAHLRLELLAASPPLHLLNRTFRN